MYVRKHRVHKANFDEKLTSKMAPYAVAEEIPNIENYFFHKHGSSLHFCVSSLRDRFTLLQTTFGILRGESMFKSELSDLIDIKFKCRETASMIHVGVMQIFEGKTNKTKTLYGRVLRHRDPFLCAMGALGFYLLVRFEVTKECDKFDMSKNKKWFNIKVLTDTQKCKDNTVGMTDKPYADAVREACKALGIITKHFAHIGRAAGAAIGALPIYGYLNLHYPFMATLICKCNHL